MPRNNGVYYLPSPPMPLVPDTLALAEDMNTVLSDIALAITGSAALDGSTAFTGPVNFNGQNVGGIGNLSVAGGISATNVTCNGLWANVAAYLTGLTLEGQMNANGQNILGVGNLTASYISVPNMNVTNDLVTPVLQVTGVANIPVLGSDMNANTHSITGINVLGAANGNISGNLAVGGSVSCTWVVMGGHAYQWVWDGVYLFPFIDGNNVGASVLSPNVHMMELNTGAGQGILYYDHSGSYVYWPIYWSDRRLKSDIEPAGDALAALRAIPVHNLHLTKPFVDAEPEHWPFSLIADEVEAALPGGAIHPPDAKGYATLNELAVLALHHRALQQLDERLAALEAR